MPVVIVDTEQAELIGAALTMFEAALTARVKRVDPEQVISKALDLQAMKLATVRTMLQNPDPPAFSDLDPTMLKKAHDLLWALHTDATGTEMNAWWEALRGVINAPGLPQPPSP
jgi:hypothetical protein